MLIFANFLLFLNFSHNLGHNCGRNRFFYHSVDAIIGKFIRFNSINLLLQTYNVGFWEVIFFFEFSDLFRGF
jgi:hypothetical protein